MELRHLRYFITVAEELNFSKAALKLYTAQPSLSQQIKDLEEDVGVKLLHRTKRKVELTEEGAVFLEQARLTLAQADKAVAMARKVASSRQQQLRIGFVPVAEKKIFPHVLPHLRMRLPELKIDLFNLNNNELLKRFKKDELDIIFTREDVKGEDVQSRFVLQEPLLFMLPKTHPLAKLERIPVEALDGIDFIISAPEQAPILHEKILGFAKQHQIQFNIIQKTENILLNLDLTSQGRGCTILPEYAKPFATPDTVIRPLEQDLPYLDLFVSYRHLSPSAAVQTFVEILNEKIPA